MGLRIQHDLWKLFHIQDIAMYTRLALRRDPYKLNIFVGAPVTLSVMAWPALYHWTSVIALYLEVMEVTWRFCFLSILFPLGTVLLLFHIFLVRLLMMVHASL